jgi:hypothetical protein
MTDANGKQKAFDAACARFTEAAATAAGWKHHFFGAAYSTRILAARDMLEREIAAAREAMRADMQPLPPPPEAARDAKEGGE